VTSAAIEAVSLHTVVFVRLTIAADIAVHADTLVAALRVLAGAMVLAGVLRPALVHVPGAVLARPVGGAATAVGVDAVHAGGAVLAQVPRTVVNVLVAVVARKPWTQT
jgi:hypothetical protein